ncbi:MAG: hypothetical protein WAQ53_11480 [Thiofilum sp.]|uniref:hypothetical protein n=1 Tax=Thiofilum sp. TaxID=2212733 RepID=UPI0025F430B5|nr:hypothetical protein [Thiofilum sp.]MBK8452625.1 hypothetical protein [Thiofilum sp.]
MTLFRVVLVLIFITLAGYTSVVISNYGMGLLPIFFGDMAKMQWPGQFNLDFMFMLSLSGLWVAWRHQFSAIGIILGIIAVFGGALFLSAYLFIESFRVQGDMKALMLGHERATQ